MTQDYGPGVNTAMRDALTAQGYEHLGRIPAPTAGGGDASDPDGWLGPLPADDGPGRDQHGEHGPRYIADPADYIGLPAPDARAVAAERVKRLTKDDQDWNGRPITLDTRLELGRILVNHRRGIDDTAGAIEAILALLADRRAYAEGPTVSDLTAERFGPTGGER